MPNPINYFDDLIKRLSKAGNAAIRVPKKEFAPGSNTFFPEGVPKGTQVWFINPHETLAHLAYPPHLREQALARIADSPYQVPTSTFSDSLYIYPTTSRLAHSSLPRMGLAGAAQRFDASAAEQAGGKLRSYRYHVAGAADNPLVTARHEIRHGIANPALEYVDASQGLGPYLRADDEMLSRLGDISDLHVEKYGKLVTSPKDAGRAMEAYWVNNMDDIPANVYYDDFTNNKERRDKMTHMLQRLLTVPAVGAAASSQMDNSNQGR